MTAADKLRTILPARSRPQYQHEDRPVFFSGRHDFNRSFAVLIFVSGRGDGAAQKRKGHETDAVFFAAVRSACEI